VLVMGWYLLPVLLFMRLRILRRPGRLMSIGAFVHDEHLRQVVNLMLRALKSDELEFIVFSEAERRNLVEVLRFPAARVHRIVYRGKIPETPARAEPYDHAYVFTGGYSNRDYETFFTAVEALQAHVVAVASALNDLPEPPANVDLRIDIPWGEFEQLIDGCALLVLPLRPGGEACGQNVLFRGIRHETPVVATRHDSLIDYLGEDYPGFVRARDPEALRTAIARGLFDDEFRRSLLKGVRAASRSFRDQEQVEVEIARILKS
jgi:glycosyltransferase involved in cell wall biosynthesis